ncbi:PAS domain-containing sensor histidine kinase [Desulfopila sp. IMCC35008]|uniref:hybrid sensor histidine kinase/response regulator n=1 Tax=Desulfopila sp. IMCC35008 TaxID=2653858 RepID=UPI0013D7F081|nr:PAS domain-containing sensor histidine kinase [Desulfopila sp. IMCC35008]
MQKKQYNLSTHIAITIISLVLVSTITVSSVLYISLIKSLTKEFEERIKAESREVTLALANRFREVETKLRTLIYDNTVRITMMLGAENQLSDHLTNVYANDPSLTFFVQKLNREDWHSSAGAGVSSLEAWQALSTTPEKRTISNDMSRQGFKLTLVLPITRQKDHIGFAAAVYMFKEDELLKATLERAHSSRLLIIDDGISWNLLTGEASDLPLSYLLNSEKSVSIEYLETQQGPYAALADNTFPNLIVLAGLSQLQEAKRRVLYSVMTPALIIILLSFFISIVLSNRMSIPLRRLSLMAHEITKGESDFAFTDTQSSIREFNQMNTSLITMIQHLDHLREMERYQEFFEGVADIVLIHDLDGHLISANEIALERFGITPDELHLSSLLNIIPEESYHKAMKLFKSLQRGGDQQVFSFTFTANSGEQIYLESSVRRIVYNTMEVILNVARDVSDRTRAEIALKQSHETLNTIMDSIQATIVACDVEDKKILFMNRYMKEITGEDLVGKSCQDHSGPEAIRCYNCSSDHQFEINVDLPPWEGQSPINNRWYLHFDRFIEWVDGRPVKFQVAFDITDIKQLAMRQEHAEKLLRKSQKMEAIGTLAGRVAHDLNNILAGIVSYPDILLASLPKNSPLITPLNIIKESGLKASATVNDLLTLARRGVQVNEVVNLTEVVTDYLDSPEHRTLMAEHLNVEILTDVAVDLRNILGSPNHLTKAIMNLVKNGVESISGSGRVKISTHDQKVTTPPPTTKVKQGEYVVLTVSDNGSGISENDIEKIFEPFFTTKVMGRSGTGLGMAVVWGTVEDHEGYIDLESTPGIGTTFKLYFPVTRVELLKEQAVLAETNFSGNGEMILVVDDIKEQREISTLVFSQLGYRVKSVSSGEEAIEYLRSHSADLVVLDMILEGGIGGLETYKRILEIHPLQKAVITSGYSRTSDVKEAMRLGAGQYVKKPFLVDEISRAVASELKKI